MAKTDRGYGPLDNHMYMYDLGWLVKTILSFREELDTAIDLKTIHYADPIQWDITTQYSPNTVVVDPKTGTAYMSKVPVPAGVQLDNTDYWVVIFNYQRIYDKIMSGVAFNDKENAEASKDISKYDFVWFGGDLYQAQRDIPQGSKYVPGVNIVATTIADALATYYGRDRVAQVINDTLTASETQTIGAKNRVINVTGDQTVTAGDIAETSANRTIKTTADYHIDVDGNLSDHVDGVTTINRGGAVTEAYGSSLDVGVTGTYTAEYRGTATDNATGKRIFNATDIILNTTNPITYKTPQPGERFDTIPFKDAEGGTYDIMVKNDKSNFNLPFFSDLVGNTDDEKMRTAFSLGGCIIDRNVILNEQHYISGYTEQTFIGINKSTITFSKTLKNSGAYNNKIAFININFRGADTTITFYELSQLSIFVKFDNCSFDNFNTVFKMTDDNAYQFSQVLTISHCLFTNIANRVLDYNHGAALLFENCYITGTCAGGMSISNCLNACIRDNVLECTTFAVQFSSCRNISIVNNYLEFDTGDFIFINDSLSKNVLIQSNIFIYKRLYNNNIINIAEGLDNGDLIAIVKLNDNYSNTAPLIGFLTPPNNHFYLILDNNTGTEISNNVKNLLITHRTKIISIDTTQTVNGWSSNIPLESLSPLLATKHNITPVIISAKQNTNEIENTAIAKIFGNNLRIYDTANTALTYTISFIYNDY